MHLLCKVSPAPLQLLWFTGPSQSSYEPGNEHVFVALFLFSSPPYFSAEEEVWGSLGAGVWRD